MDHETDVRVREQPSREVTRSGLDTETSYGRSAPPPGSTVTVEHLRWRRISWRAILGGAAVALALQTPLILLGLGIGMINADAISDVADIALANWIWWLVAGIISTFFGAWVAGHLVAPATPLDGALNGFVTWAVLTLVMLWLAATTATSLIGGAWSTLTSASQALVGGGSSPAEVMVRTQSGQPQQRQQGEPVVEMSQPRQGEAPQVEVNWSEIGRDVQQFLGQLGIDAQGLNLEDEFEDFGEAPIQNTEAFYSNLKSWLTGDDPRARERLERYLADNTDLTEQEIDERLDRWEEQAQQAARETSEAVEQGAEAVGQAALWTAAGSLVALLAAGAGGALGAASASPRRRKRP